MKILLCDDQAVICDGLEMLLSLEKDFQVVAAAQTQPSSLLTEKLTERETDVLHLIAKGFNNGEIAGELYLSEGTVRNHVSAILEKTWRIR